MVHQGIGVASTGVDISERRRGISQASMVTIDAAG